MASPHFVVLSVNCILSQLMDVPRNGSDNSNSNSTSATATITQQQQQEQQQQQQQQLSHIIKP